MTSRDCIACRRMRWRLFRASAATSSRSSAIAVPCSVSVPTHQLEAVVLGRVVAAGDHHRRGGSRGDAPRSRAPASARRRCRSRRRGRECRRSARRTGAASGRADRGPPRRVLPAARLPIAVPIARTVVSSRSRSATPRMSYSRKLRGFTAHRYLARPRAERASITLRTSCACVLPDDQDRVPALDHHEIATRPRSRSPCASSDDHDVAGAVDHERRRRRPCCRSHRRRAPRAAPPTSRHRPSRRSPAP